MRPWLKPLTWAIVAAPLLVLLAPAIHYALDTPIGLFERQGELGYSFNGLKDVVALLHRIVAGEEHRFRPFFNFWNGLQWKLFGDVAWLHHLVRWLMLFGAVALFMAAFRRVADAGVGSRSAAGAVPQVLPMALLAYVWLLFPTAYVIVRVECVELYTMFFLGVCNFAAALMLTQRRGQHGTGRGPQALLLFGFVGLVGSKEVNVAPALWIALCYVALCWCAACLGNGCWWEGRWR